MRLRLKLQMQDLRGILLLFVLLVYFPGTLNAASTSEYDSNITYPNDTPTSDLCKPVFDEYGNMHAGRTLYACAFVMQDPYIAVTSVAQYADQNLTVYSDMVLNNLIEMNELDNYVVIDLYFRLKWQDIRWEIPEMWKYLPISSQYDGIEIAPLVRRGDEPLPIWVPDIQFQDLIQTDEVAVLFKLRPNGQFFYSRHLKIVVMQSKLDLSQYPKDKQHVLLRYESYGLTGGVMDLKFSDPPVHYVYDDRGEINFEHNPVWYHKVNNYVQKTFVVDYTTDPAFKRYFIALQIDLLMERAGKGVVIRFAVPILILLLLAGATYWSQLDSRVDTTMTILLAVSALYVVIIGSIPQLGYLTIFDSWIFAMFILLSTCVIGHLVSIVLIRKAEDQPLRLFASRVVEMMGRVFVFPIIVLMYIFTFFDEHRRSHWSFGVYVFFMVISVAYVILVFREVGGTFKSFRNTLQEIENKLNDGRHPSSKEIRVFNFFRFNVISKSLDSYRSKKARDIRRRAETANVEMSGSTLTKIRKNLVFNRKKKRMSDVYDSDDDDIIEEEP